MMPVMNVDSPTAALAAPADREGSLLAWQLRHYLEGHRDRRNLAIHAVTAPLFCLGAVALASAPIVSWWLALGALPMVAALAAQGRGHGREASRPAPFRGPSDFVVRLVAEQCITFPRFVLGGGFGRSWRAAAAPRPR